MPTRQRTCHLLPATCYLEGNEVNLLKTLWNWLRPKLAALFTLTAKGVAKGVLDTLNDPELQHLAYAAVKAAAENGLKGNEAFDVALSALTVKLRQEGRELSTSLRETLVQNAYVVFRHAKDE